MLVQISRECTPPYLSTGISNLLQLTQAEVVLGQLSSYLVSWGVFVWSKPVSVSQANGSPLLIGERYNKNPRGRNLGVKGPTQDLRLTVIYCQKKSSYTIKLLLLVTNLHNSVKDNALLISAISRWIRYQYSMYSGNLSLSWCRYEQ